MRKIIFTLLSFLVPFLSYSYDIKIDGLCYNLNKEDKTAEVTYILGNKFNGDYFTGDITIPEKFISGGVQYSVVCIGDRAFHDCSNLNSVVIPNSVKTIGSGAFSGCKYISSIVLGDSVETIGYQAFFGCFFNLVSINIPTSVSYIGGKAFESCNNLTSFTVPDSVKSIEYGTFLDCSNLTSVSIGNSVDTIGNLAFRNCTELSKVVIGKSVNHIGYYAFENCKNLRDVFCYAEIVPTVAGFAGFEESRLPFATLYVPRSSLNDYKSTYPWRIFGKILPIEDYTGIDVIENYPSSFSLSDNAVVIKNKNLEGKKVSVYSVDGCLLGCSVIEFGECSVHTNLKTGSVVLVMIDKKCFKVKL